MSNLGIVLGVDIDGVLGNFNESFKSQLIKVTGRDLFPSGWTELDINCWNYPTDQYGYTKEEYKATWKATWESYDFWSKLGPYRDTVNFLCEVRKMDNVYFVTQRSGVKVKAQTENWLRRWGSMDNPTVLLSGDKGGVAKALGLTHYIDDKTENCDEVVRQSPSTKCVMLAKPWNTKLVGIPRVESIMDFLDMVEKDASRPTTTV